MFQGSFQQLFWYTANSLKLQVCQSGRLIIGGLGFDTWVGILRCDRYELYWHMFFLACGQHDDYSRFWRAVGWIMVPLLTSPNRCGFLKPDLCRVLVNVRLVTSMKTFFYMRWKDNPLQKGGWPRAVHSPQWPLQQTAFPPGRCGGLWFGQMQRFTQQASDSTCQLAFRHLWVGLQSSNLKAVWVGVKNLNPPTQPAALASSSQGQR